MSRRLQVGSQVTVSNGDGTVRWMGTDPEFAAGSWVGVELYEANGKNDGSVKGKSYFHCQPLYGVFVRPGSIKVIEGSEFTGQVKSWSTPDDAYIGTNLANLIISLQSRPPSSASQPVTLSGTSSPARRQSTATPFSLSRTTSSAGPSNPLQQKLTRAAAGLPASSSSRDLSTLSKRPSHALDRRAPSPTPSPESTPTPAPRPNVSARTSRPPSTLASITSAGLPRASAISTGRASSRPTSSASTHSRASRPSSVASNNELDDGRPLSRSSHPDHLHSASSIPASDDATIEQLQDTPRPSAEPRKFGRGLAQNLASQQAIRSRPNDPSDSDVVGDNPADVFRAARLQRATISSEAIVANTAVVPASDGSRVAVREVEDLRIKIRVLEGRRAEDAERIKTLEAKALEAETDAQAKEKLRTRFLEIQQDLSNQRRQAKDAEKARIAAEAREAELNDQLEMITLDKEMAEEKTETLESHIAQLEEQVEGMKIEVEVLQEENAKYDQPIAPGEERSSVAFVQLEKQNERLKEALMRLRDMSNDTEKLQKARIAELEKETSGSGGLHLALQSTQAELQAAELQLDDLKQQLEVALGADEMLEMLTERTLTMGEKIEEMRIHIEDLEAIKEMNDEMEEGHVETEKHLQETIDTLAMDLREQRDRETDLEALVADREGTILQFRDLVQGLQNELNDLRTKYHETEAETANLSAQSRTMLNMNLKLQNSASKTQARALDLELAKIEAKVAREQVEMVEAYLPRVYYEADFEATNAVLRVHRLSGKADLLVSTFCSMHNLPDALIEVTNDRLPGICEVRGLITVFSNLLQRLASSMSRGPPQEFLALSRLNSEFSHIEEKMDQWFDSIRRNEFSERDCSLELVGYVAELEHALGSITSGVDLDTAERQLGLALAFDYELDNFAASVGLARHGILEMIQDPDSLVQDPIADLEQEIFEPVQRILNQVRTVKLNSMKLVECLRGLVTRSTALEHDLHTPLRLASESVSRATDVAVQLAQKIGSHLNDLRGTQEPLQLSVVLDFLRQVTSAINPQGDIRPWDIIGMFVTRLSTDLNSLLPRIQSAIEEGHLLQTGLAGPWVLRADTLRSDVAANAEAETRIASQSEQITSLMREVKLRDQTLEETQVKVRYMTRRLEDSKKSADLLSDLETRLERASTLEQEAGKEANKLHAELLNLETENARLRAMASAAVPSGASEAARHGVNSMLISGGSLHSERETASLKAAIDILRRENTLLKAEGMLGQLEGLPKLYHTNDRTPRSQARPADTDISSESDELPQTPTDKPSQRVPKKHLWLELASLKASASVIDLTKVKSGRGWQPLRRMPEAQMFEQRREEERLVRRLQDRLLAAN